MSDFDREAERERLREKYERDQEKRASTQRMSELLLQGATMTDSHCDACGDPVFRYEGEEFCATCKAEGEAADRDDAQGAEEGETAQARGQPQQDRTEADRATAEQTQPTAGERTGDALANGAETPAAARGGGSGPSAPGRSADTPEQSAAPRREPAPDDAPAEAARGGGSGPSAPGRSADTPEQSAAPRREPAPADAPADLSEARASLVRTATRFARRAEAADHPSEAADSLAAAREAAEALAALDRR